MGEAVAEELLLSLPLIGVCSIRLRYSLIDNFLLGAGGVSGAAFKFGFNLGSADAVLIKERPAEDNDGDAMLLPRLTSELKVILDSGGAEFNDKNPLAPQEEVTVAADEYDARGLVSANGWLFIFWAFSSSSESNSRDETGPTMVAGSVRVVSSTVDTPKALLKRVGYGMCGGGIDVLIKLIGVLIIVLGWRWCPAPLPKVVGPADV